MMESLPSEIIEKVLLKLENTADVARCTLVCWEWNRIIHSKSFDQGQPASYRPIVCSVNGRGDVVWQYIALAGANSNYPIAWNKFKLPNWEEMVGIFDPAHKIMRKVSQGLLCCYLSITQTERDAHVCIYSLFGSSARFQAPEKFLAPAVDVSDMCFHFDSLSQSYVVMLTDCESYVVYTSATKRWRQVIAYYHLPAASFFRSRPNLFRSSHSILSPACLFLGGTFYVFETYLSSLSFNIDGYGYNIASAKMSTKPFLLPQLDNLISGSFYFDFDFSLADNNGTLMLLATTLDRTIFIMVASEQKDAFVFSTISSIKLKAILPQATYNSFYNLRAPYGRRFIKDIVCGHDLVLLLFRDMPQILAHNLSTKTWQWLEHPRVNVGDEDICFLPRISFLK